MAELSGRSGEQASQHVVRTNPRPNFQPFRLGGGSHLSVQLPSECIDCVASTRLETLGTPLVTRLGDAEPEAVPLQFIDTGRPSSVPFLQWDRGVEQDEVDGFWSPLGVQLTLPFD